jgi:tetratricopeptide (TPR) repeat protein
MTHWLDEAYRCLQQGDVQGAAKAADLARDADPDHPRVLLLAGHMLVMLGMYDMGQDTLHQAAQWFQRAGLPVPGQLYNSLGMAAMKQFQHDEAKQWFQQALAVDEHQPEPYIGLGTLEMDRGDNPEAGHWFGEAIRRFPASTAVRWGRCFYRLRRGEWPAAWSDYEMRLTAPDWIARWGKHLDVPLWYGQPTPDCTLMTFHEQGQGDTLMLSRYLPFLRERSQCARLYLLVPDEMLTLMDGLADWVGWKNPPDPKPDYAVALTSIPYIHATRLDNVPPPLRLAA